MHEPYTPGSSFQPATLVDLLRALADHQADFLAFTFLIDGDKDEISLTFAEVDRRAKEVAAWLQEHKATGERALLLFPPGLDFVVAFYGCLYAGVTAVPVFPPRLNKPSPRIQGIVKDCGAQFALTTTNILRGLERRFTFMPELATLRWLDIEELPTGIGDQWRETAVTPDTLAFLQYTSGSTGTPKGVMVSHRNLLHNLEAIRQGFKITPPVVGVFWLPSYHDMGLIGGILEPMYAGGQSVTMAPAAFLQRPLRWLQAISRYNHTVVITGAPNFAYRMCVEKTTPEQRQALDLSGWKVAFCGAEPIHKETLALFAETFAPHGFQADAFYPCYGLAEATLLVAGGDGPAALTATRFEATALKENRAVASTTTTEEAVTIVSCGHTVLDQQLVIVDPDNFTHCETGHVGEIWVAGGSVAQGYWGRPEETAVTFQATPANSAEGPFLRTGDLGFIHEGELYITGRLKDLIIIRGRNHYPQDIENSIGSSHPALEAGMGAAFAVEIDGEEQLVVINEVARQHRNPNMAEVVTAVRRTIAQEHQLQLHSLVLIKHLSVPKTSSGKIRRFACKQAYLAGKLKIIAQWQRDDNHPQELPEMIANTQSNASLEKLAYQPSANDISIWLVSHLAQQLRLPRHKIDVNVPFVDYGLDSVQAVTLAADLESWLGRPLPATLIWDHPTIAALAPFLSAEQTEPQPQPTAITLSDNEPIAIIGLSCRFPGAKDANAFWDLLHEGKDAINEVPANRWAVDTLYDAAENPLPGKMTTRWGGFLTQVDQFDAQFFGISPREATRMDPQQRLLLEVAWEALENAGQNPAALNGTAAGVFVGISSSDYTRQQFSNLQMIDAYAGTGNAHSIAANRLSYTLGLQGPSMAIDTACSSSLVAVHLAMQSLRSGETGMALAGGVNMLLNPDLTITFSQARMMARDGRCKTFDERADGYVRGEGCGLVVLKRLADAQRDGDPILSVLRGSAVNQDGRSNGLTAPNGLAQQAVIRRALHNAGLTTTDLSYVEAHGTGTRLGDPIEVHALQAVFDGATAEPQANALVVGSAKTNIGHLEAAAGIAGLIKTVLALQHEEIPPHLHLKTLNSHIDLANSRLRLDAQTHPWPRQMQPRRAGISSFGFGGTNAHLIVEEAPLPQTEPTTLVERPQHILTLSAPNAAALNDLSDRYAAFLEQRPYPKVADICYTANTGRAQFAHRLAVIGSTAVDLQQQLTTAQQNKATTPPRIAFLFTGQGAQYIGMGRTLYETQPTFRAAMDRCAAILETELPRPLLEILFQQPTPQNHLYHPLDQTSYTQPALFAVEYALVELWRSWGIEPDIVMGHSVGEYVAAYVAGVFTLAEGLRLVAARGRLMQALPAGGTMAAVFATKEVVETAIAPFADRLAVAAINGPENVVIAGAATAVTAVTVELTLKGIESRPLTVSHAFHSQLMAPMLAEFEAVAAQINFQPPQIPLVGNVTGQILTVAPDATYWRQHVRQTVQFAAGMKTLAAAEMGAYIEIGPQPHLLSNGRRNLPQSKALWLPSLRQQQDDWQPLLSSLAHLYRAGAAVDWHGFDRAYRRHKVVLPTYPFQREHYWLEVDENSPQMFSGARNGVRRLPTALPIFEEQLHIHELQDYTAHAQRVAEAFWGAGTHEVTLLPLPATAVTGSTRLQTILTLSDADNAFLQTFVFDEARAGWQLKASGQLQRGQTVADVVKATAVAEQIAPLSRDMLLAADENRQQQQIAQFLHTEIALIMGLDLQRLDHNQPLDMMGLDSLMALELKNRIEHSLQLDVPVVNLLQGPTLNALTEQLVELLQQPMVERQIIQPLSDPHLPFPLSPGQQSMWVLHQLLPQGVSFNVSGAVRLLGALDLAAMQQAWQMLITRHAALRTVFDVRNGRIQQTILSEPTAPSLFTVAAQDWHAPAVEKYLIEAAHRPFDLAQGPLLRLVILQRAANEHIFLLALNHLITDFWSMAILVQELISFYELAQSGDQTPLPAIDLTYADYVGWQSEMLAGAAGKRLRNYWLDQLSGPLPRLDLPTDRPRAAHQTFHGDSVHHRFPAALTSQLQALSHTNGSTLATTLLAAFQALLHRYSGQDDLLVGSVVAGRDRPELQPLIGYFVNPVALRAYFSDELSFVDLLAQVRQTMLEAIEHQAYPLPLLAEEMAASRQQRADPSRPPLFETMFIMQRAQAMAEQGLTALALDLPGTAVTLGNLTLESISLGGLPAQFDITLMMAEVDDGLAATLHYNTALYDKATMQRFLDHLQMLLIGVIAEPQRPLPTIPLLPPAEQETLLSTWNKTEADFPHTLCLHELFAAQAAQTPEATAVACAGQSLTYAELDQKANQLAHHLQQQGAKPQMMIGLLLERSVEMMVGLLAILKAGGCYIPLDPDFPRERLTLMLDDAQPPLLITQSSLAGLIATPAIQRVCIDEDWPQIAQQPHDAPQNQVTAADLAYIIYTSGSTGKPKGVQIAHRAAVNFLTAMQKEPGLDADDHLLAVTTLSFDIALLELFLPLINGAQVTIAKRETALDGLQLQQLLHEADITVMQATPATWRLLLEAGWQGQPNLKILCGGEALSRDLAQQLLPRCRQLWNMYGPTETTVWSTTCRIKDATQLITIGRPIANTQLYLLDAQMAPVPIGVVGNLYIGGAGVAQGYLNRRALTAERFVPNPFHHTTNGATTTLYKTGDLARYTADGQLIFLGRDDFQVKVRGFRIELGDIEAALTTHTAVAQSVVIAAESKTSAKQLVAYLIPLPGQPLPATAQLRDYLAAKLPGYMIPAVFVSLKSLPLTPNGKVDRRALPAVETNRLQLQTTYTPPRNELETQLVTICAEVLGVEQIGIHDDFFDLGGNSLLAMRLIYQIREQLQVQVPLRQLFTQPTVAGLSQAIGALQKVNGRNGYLAENGYKNGNGQPMLNGVATAVALTDLQADVTLEPSITANDLPLANIFAPQHILLTGATGFVGAFLLRDLLTVEATAVVTCLVRAKDAQSGMRRLQKNMQQYGLWDDTYKRRIHILLGDLAQPNLGLSPQLFTQLASQIDIIYHNGALVNFVYGYQQHYAANVQSTQTLLQLASEKRLKALHFVSTLSVFHSGQHDDGTIYYENADLEQIGVPFGGYAQSKWVAEKIMLLAKARGLPIAIYRPGLVSGDSQTGAWNTADMMSTMAQTCFALGVVPDLAIDVNLVPVDYVSQAIVTLSRQTSSIGKRFNLTNPQVMPYKKMLAWFTKAGVPLQLVAFETWREMLLNLATQLGGELDNPFLPLLEEVTAAQIFMPSFDNQNVLKALADKGIVCAPVDAQLLDTYVQYFKKVGLLPKIKTSV